jgi:hypothetical protein
MSLTDYSHCRRVIGLGTSHEQRSAKLDGKSLVVEHCLFPSGSRVPYCCVDIRAIADQEMTEALAALQSRDFNRAVKLLEVATSKLHAIASGQGTPDIAPK